MVHCVHSRNVQTPCIGKCWTKCTKGGRNTIIAFPLTALSKVPFQSSTLLFIALQAMQTRSSDENSVCPSVKHVICDKTKE